MAVMFESLQVHRKAVDFADRLATLTESFPRDYDFFVGQLNRAALSIATDLAEGQPGQITICNQYNSGAVVCGVLPWSIRGCESFAPRVLDGRTSKQLRLAVGFQRAKAFQTITTSLRMPRGDSRCGRKAYLPRWLAWHWSSRRVSDFLRRFQGCLPLL